ncbi:adenosine deaminase [Mycolicibacterium litorale]|nr:adenosine deaminase [Mycolicibacterium litorale]
MTGTDDAAAHLPKNELHVHLEGTLEPAMLLTLAARNSVCVPWSSVDELERAYRFRDLQDFLNLLFRAAGVLRTAQDFHELAYAYFTRAHIDGVRRAEVFFGPQTFLDASVSLSTQLDGVLQAADDAHRDLGIEAAVILTAQRHRTEAQALELLAMSEPWHTRLLGFGLGGAERGNPPSKFERYFAQIRKRGLRTTIHAGEDGPADYVRQALDVCRVDRIDHGVSAVNDSDLVKRIRDEQIPLTMCPLSNQRLNVTPDLGEHPLAELLRAGALVTVNSDDPPYFGGYVNDNYRAVAAALDLTATEIAQLARNSFTASFDDAENIRRGLNAVAAAAGH